MDSIPVLQNKSEVAVGEGISSPGARKRARLGVLLAGLLALAVALAYALYTGHTWEDFFITFRHSENLCQGRGLVYDPPLHVHGFTSPLGALLPAFCHWATGLQDYLHALWLYRILSAIAFAFAVGLMAAALARQFRQAYLPALGFGAVLLSFDVKTVAFSMNGMETAWLVLFLALGLYMVSGDRPGRGWLLGIVWAGLMWSRPDAVVWIAGMLASAVFFGSGPLQRRLRCLALASLVGIVLYAPWFLWARNYYGSPVPHTVIAKSNVEWGDLGHLREALLNNWRFLPDVVAVIFQPIYFLLSQDWLDGTGGGHIISQYSRWLGGFAGLYWLCPVRDRLGRMASLCFAIGCFYFSLLYFIYPWYMPPASMLGAVALTSGLITLGKGVQAWLSRHRWHLPLEMVSWILLSVVCAAQLALFGLVTWEMRVQQAEIEDGLRTRIGLWLKEHLRSNDRIYLEPLGYIGYFSGGHMLDFPGLATPEVVRLRRESHIDQYTMVACLQPEWVVFRAREVAAMANSPAAAFFDEEYRLAEKFDIGPRLAEYRFIPGRDYLLYDANYSVYKRKDIKRP
jgi:hypothetical protein